MNGDQDSSREESTTDCRWLERGEIDALLARNSLGRIVYVRANQIDIEPVQYLFSNGWLYGRTSAGRNLQMTDPGWWPVAFQVDEVEDGFHWRSVVVHGGFYTLDPNGSGWEREEVRKAMTLLPHILHDVSTAPGRSVLFRIGAQEVTGREQTRGSRD